MTHVSLQKSLGGVAASLVLLLAALPAVLALPEPAAAQGYYDDDPDGPPPMPGPDGRYPDPDAAPYDASDRGGDDPSYDQPYDPAGDDADDYEDGRNVPDASYFYAELEDEGRWVYHPNYGRVWIPRDTDRSWRPYTRGHWVHTEDYGWYWVSDERFGWATYHYGRWYLDGRYGWVWVPGTRWAPAWVAWRSSDDYLGWAPLPPDAYWEPHHGLRYDTAIYESPRFSMYWSFVEPAYIVSPHVHRYFVPDDRRRTIIYRTRPETHYAFHNKRIVNRGVSVKFIEERSKVRITSHRITHSAERSYRGSDRRDGEAIHVFRPKLSHREASHGGGGRGNIPPRREWRDVDRAYKAPKATGGRGEPPKGAAARAQPNERPIKGPASTWGQAPRAQPRTDQQIPWASQPRTTRPPSDTKPPADRGRDKSSAAPRGPSPRTVSQNPDRGGSKTYSSGRNGGGGEPKGSGDRRGMGQAERGPATKGSGDKGKGEKGKEYEPR